VEKWQILWEWGETDQSIASFKEFSLGGTRLKFKNINTKIESIIYILANFSSYWSSKLSFIQRYPWWRNSSCVTSVFWISVSSVFLPSETWRLLVSGQNSRCLMSWAQYTFGCSQTSETCYFWDQFSAVCDTSLLSPSTCCVEKWPERSESVCSTHISVNFAEVHRVWLWWNQSVWTSGLTK